MKSEPKAFASLSSGLLARKGAARPAMRPQGFGQGAAGLEDLGWNDMGFEPPKPAETPERDADHDAFGEEIADHPLRNPVAGLTPIESPVHDQQAQIAGRLSAFAPGDEGEEDEIDETAELEPEFDDNVDFDEPEAEPVAAASVTKSKPVAIAPVAEVQPVVRSVPAPTPVRRRQGEGGIHAPARSGAPPQASPGVRRQRPVGADARDPGGRPAAEFDAAARRDGAEGQTQGIR